jgi:hypothetical protein
MPEIGHFILHSNVMPAITAGHYELVSDQTGLPFDVAAEHTHVTVAAPRYTMPTDQILSTFPPANAEGAFGDRLPQIVLKRRTLPWERNPAEQVEASPTPWLALVVVAEGEAQLSTATKVAECVTAGTTLLDPADKDVEQGLYLAVTETVVKKIFPCREDLALLVHVREVDVDDTELANGDDDGWLAVVLANRLPVFDIANKKPIRYMACLLNIEGQLAALPPPEPPDNHFEFELAQDWSVLAQIDPAAGPDSRVMGGIDFGDIVLPVAGLRAARPAGAPRAAASPQSVISKVSSPGVGSTLNGGSTIPQVPVGEQWIGATQKVSTAALSPDAKYLVRDMMASGFRFPIELYAPEKVFRFPVLAHWSFTTNEGATFETLMQGLDVGLLGTVLKPPAEATVTTLPEVVETGHIALGHRSRRGDTTRAWYRGPFVPFPTVRDPEGTTRPPLAHSADQIRRVVPDGREDLSLAAAFEIGRLLGLSQLSIVSALLRFRSEQFGVGRVRELVSHATGFPLAELAEVAVDLNRFVALQFIGEMVKRPEQVIGPRRPVADPGRQVAVRGNLDEMIAEGLGLDLTAVRKMADQVGVAAALAGANVPVAERRADVSVLRTALETELAHVIDVAAPVPVVRGGVGRARAQAPPAPDALDELIKRASASGSLDEDEG